MWLGTKGTRAGPFWAGLGLYRPPKSPGLLGAKYVALGDRLGNLWAIAMGLFNLTGGNGPYTHPRAHLCSPGLFCAWPCPARRFEAAAACSEWHLALF